VNETCPWSERPIADNSLTIYDGAVVGSCNPARRGKVEAAISPFDAAMEEKRNG